MEKETSSQKRLVYSLLKPAIRAASLFRIPLKEFTELLHGGYIEELERQGKRPNEIALVFGQTVRHVNRVKSKLRDDFLSAERSVGLLREIEFLLANAPQSRANVETHFAHSGERNVQLAIDDLLATERIREVDGVLHRQTRYSNLVRENFTYQIDGLNNLLDITFQAVRHRLIRGELDNKSLARAFRFVASPVHLVRFVERWLKETRLEMMELEDHATDPELPKQRYCLSMVVTPADED